MATDTELKAKKLEQARKANADRNQERLNRLNEIADGSDAAHAHEMEETDGEMILKEADNKLPPKVEVEDEKKLNASDEQSEEKDEKVDAKEDEHTDEEKTEVKADAEDNSEQESDTSKQESQDEHKEETNSDEKVINGVLHYLTVVNGKEKWMTLSQLREKAQKVESADEYLSNAAEAAKTVVRADPSKQDDTAKVEEDDLEATLSSAVLGDQEAIKKIASAFSEMKKSQARPSVTTDVVKEIDSRMAFRTAVDWFEGEYAKELQDPILKKLIYDKDAELATANPTMSYKERLKKAGDDIRTWSSGMKGVQAKTSSEKIERKKTHVTPPSSASQRQVNQVDEEEEESIESVIQKMAKARGQNRAIVHRNPTR